MPSNENNTNGRKLELDRSRIARAFSEDESLWEDEINRMFTLLKDHVQFPDKSSEKHKEESPPLSIGVFGAPGSGKSSLVKTFVNRVRDNNLPKKFEREIGGKVCSLKVITPNQQSGDDHFLYTFLAKALEADRNAHKEKKNSYHNSSILSEVQQKFQEVSEYLQVINDTERKHRKADDPLGASLDRLERHESDLLLVEKMHEFIDILANTLGNASVILLPVDDADFSLHVLTTALETCWRYLQHSKLVPIFTFTGRLAEELLRVQFEENLRFKNSDNERSKLSEASTTLLITETMAMQYMSKLFPVRNRIRMGQASARVLDAKYQSLKTESEREVRGLVRNVSRLLYGFSNPLIPEIRAPLRMVTLRRQLQIVDAMQDANVDGLVNYQESIRQNGKNGDDKKEHMEKPWKPWGKAFDFATWTLLNTHRDILKEINLSLDDLYGWTPQGLRLVLLNSVLTLDTQKRWELLNHWRYRSEERRSQVISLLAANIFRPRMRGEEKTGDDQEFLSIEKDADDEMENKNTGKRNHRLLDCSFSVRKATSWFLRLCVGFYLPQYLVVEVKKLPQDTKDFVNGAGWGLISGPVHAMREAVNHGKIFSTGMVLLDPGTLSKVLRDCTDPSMSLMLHLWCFYGYEGQRPWAAVSLWRGLGLLGRLLESDLNFKKSRKSYRKKIIREHLKRHFQETMVIMSHTPEDPKTTQMESTTFRELEYSTIKETHSFTVLVDKIMAWLNKYRPDEEGKKNRIFPMDVGDSAKNSSDHQWEWDHCFVRRIHGESIISTFFKSLDKIYVKDYLDDKKNLNADDVIRRWCVQIGDYWDGCIGNVRELILRCPFVLPFLDVATIESMGFSKKAINSWDRFGNVINSSKKSKSIFSELKIQEKEGTPNNDREQGH